MSYVPHTPDEIRSMLEQIGANSIEELFEAECGCDLQFKPGDLLRDPRYGNVFNPSPAVPDADIDLCA